MKRPRRGVVCCLRVVAGLVCWLCFGCSKGAPEQHGSTASSPSVSQSASAEAAAPSALPSAVPVREPTCRALRVVGDAKVGDVPLASGAELDGSAWVVLAKDASLTLKHAGTGRELAVAGPARFRACRRGREQLLLAEGKVSAGSGMGVRPGAEVLVATPIAVVRYADADFTLSLDSKKLSLEVRAGQLDIDPASASQKPPKTPLHAKDKTSLPLGKPDPTALLAVCKEAAENAEATARRVGDRNAPESLGERAQAHVRARKAARAACTIAAAATGLVADPTASAGLWAEAERWEGLWETIPRRGTAQGPEK
jgi:hypothetical protein